MDVIELAEKPRDLRTHKVPGIDIYARGEIAPQPSKSTRFVFMGATNDFEKQIHIPHGDVIIHLGERHITDIFSLRNLDDALLSLGHRHKVAICGEHAIDDMPELL